MRDGFLAAQAGKASRHAVHDRVRPSRWQYDYLTLSRLSRDVEGADYEGTAEARGLHDASFDLVMCTQVLEHCMNPWAAVRAIHRTLKPSGYAIVSAPHVWLFHPHPHT
jgi:SAM-dependent methyltransferase